MTNERDGDPERARARRTDHERRNEQQSILIQQELERMRRSRIDRPVEHVNRHRGTGSESIKNR